MGNLSEVDMMTSKPFIIIEYKYPERPWAEYDRTKVVNWANVQFDRMKAEHPTAAEFRRRKG